MYLAEASAAFYLSTTARVNTLPPPRILFSQSRLELGIWLQIYFEQYLICGVKSSFAFV